MENARKTNRLLVIRVFVVELNPVNKLSKDKKSGAI